MCGGQKRGILGQAYVIAKEAAMNATVSPEEISRVVAPLDPILSDDSVRGIMIDGHERMLVERDGQIEEADSPFASAEELQAVIDGLFGLYGVQLDAAHPVGYLRLPDHSRCTAVVPPNVVGGPHLVLRRIVGARLTWEKLIGWGSIPQQAVDLLTDAVNARVNILVSGGTNSGKTTVAGLIADLIPAEERMIVVEQAYEMQLEHPDAIRLEAGGPAGLSREEILAAAVHMAPERLVVGELNGPFAAAALTYLGSGYDGSLTLIHGTSVEDALRRLESLCLMADLGLGLAEIRALVAAGIQLVTFQERLPDGRRKVTEIAELRGVEHLRYVLQPLMRYNRDTGQFEFTGVKPGWEQ
jgi:pilus assembly protein CpaF